MTFPVVHPKNKLVTRSRVEKPLFIRARAFARSSKESTPFVIYAASTSGEKISTTSIPEQYKDFQDVFQKKNVGKLLEH